MMDLGLQVKASKRNDYAQPDCDRERMVRGALSGKEYMRLVLSLLFVMTLSGCAGFAHKDNLSNQVDQREALIQVAGKDHIICYIDDRAIFGSANEKSVAPGVRDVVVTERGCKNPVRFLINASAGFIYRISPNRLSLKIFNNSMEDVGELLLDSSLSGQLLSREQYDRKIHGERYRLKLEYERQVLLEEAAIQRRRINLPNVRKIGAQICQQKNGLIGHSPISIIYFGYVEGVSDERIQIRIYRASLKENPLVSPGGFSPSIIWDDPLNWETCTQ